VEQGDGKAAGDAPGAKEELLRRLSEAGGQRSGEGTAAGCSAPSRGKAGQLRLGVGWDCRRKVGCGGGPGAHLKGRPGLGVRATVSRRLRIRATDPALSARFRAIF